MTAIFKSLATARIASRISWVLVLSVPVDVSDVSGGLESSTGWESTRTLALCSQPTARAISAMRVKIEVERMKSPFTPARVPATGHIPQRIFLNRSDPFRAIFTPSANWQNAPRHEKRRTDEREEEQRAKESGDDGALGRPLALFGLPDSQHTHSTTQPHFKQARRGDFNHRSTPRVA